MDDAKKLRMNRQIGKVKVMRSVLAQLSVIISVSLLLTACPSNEGAKAVSDPIDFFAGPIPKGLPVFLEINEPYWAHDHNSHSESEIDKEHTLSLYSVALPEEGEAISQPVALFSASSEQITSLNTVSDESDQARTEMSILVNAGNVYKIDHQKGADTNGSIRLINHFVNKVCEVIPVEIVKTETVGNDVTHTVLHSDEIVYVLTVEGAVTAKDCADPAKVKRFYELPLNYQFNADDDDETQTNTLKPPVSESLARGQLIFGWVDDEVTPAVGDQRLTYGYLGYAHKEKELNFYDENRMPRWCQPRGLQEFDVEKNASGIYSAEYLFELTALEKQQYQLQTGLDVFVFDSTADIFSKPDNVSFCEFGSVSDIKSESDVMIENILTDRIFKTKTHVAGFTGLQETVQSIVSFSDDNEVVIIDDLSVFRYNYLASYTAPSTTRNFSVAPLVAVSIDKVRSQESAYPFSQFDVTPCAAHSNTSACHTAHNVEANDWQFITGCDVGKGCELANETSDFCATADELSANPNAGPLCSVLNYQDLGELNNVNNDAEFRGFMQYGADFITSLAYRLHEDSLLITARMSEKEILLRYSYNVDSDAAKAERETVLFGARLDHYGLDVYVNENNLFATVLWKAQKRENECYKNYQQVTCDLGSLVKGGTDECSTFDLDNRDCFNGFQEYNSTALFCSAADLSDGRCNDDSIIASNGIVVHEDEESAKWLKLYDLSDGSSHTHKMYLLKGNKSTVEDEGVLVDPELHAVDNSIGEPMMDNVLGQLSGKVEAVRSGWVSNDNLARFDVTAQEVERLDRVVNDVNSVSNIYMVTDPNLLIGSSLNKHTINVGELKSPRLITQLDSTEN